MNLKSRLEKLEKQRGADLIPAPRPLSFFYGETPAPTGKIPRPKQWPALADFYSIEASQNESTIPA